ncbi:CD1375 family protein [Cytobacillus spongiae]|nr:CD1375 family protein [Cytobacillus spongiae]
MVEMYVRLVQEGRRSIEEVPEKYRTEVQAIIEGGTTNG